MSPAEAIVQTRIQQLKLQSPIAAVSPSETRWEAVSSDNDNRPKEVCNQSHIQKSERIVDEKKREAKEVKQTETSATSVPDLRDGRSFLKLVDETCDNIRKRMKQTESLMEEESISEEVEGKVRAVIGKADLLMSKKLNQFRELCLHNIVSR